MADERSKTTKAFRIHGRVQGVGFRWSTRRQAERLGLRGTVRNCPDGTVEVVLDGPGDAVSRMRDWLESGPSSAHVVRLEEIPPPESLPSNGFRIVH